MFLYQDGCHTTIVYSKCDYMLLYLYVYVRLRKLAYVSLCAHILWYVKSIPYIRSENVFYHSREKKTRRPLLSYFLILNDLDTCINIIVIYILFTKKT